jgi:hypothetical protein
MSLITVNDNNFKEAIEKSDLVLVDFWHRGVVLVK